MTAERNEGSSKSKVLEGVADRLQNLHNIQSISIWIQTWVWIVMTLVIFYLFVQFQFICCSPHHGTLRAAILVDDIARRVKGRALTWRFWSAILSWNCWLVGSRRHWTLRIPTSTWLGYCCWYLCSPARVNLVHNASIPKCWKRLPWDQKWSEVRFL